MSRTFCRFCSLHFMGLYLNCPKCGKWLAPTAGHDIAPDPDGYQLADDRESFKNIDRIVNAGLRRAFLNGRTDYELTLELKADETRPTIDEQVAHLQSDIMAAVSKELPR